MSCDSHDFHQEIMRLSALADCKKWRHFQSVYSESAADVDVHSSYANLNRWFNSGPGQLPVALIFQSDLSAK